jgi:hypothetical protein
MSLVNQPIFRKGAYDRSISNSLNLGAGPNISTVVPFGGVDITNEFASSSGGVITINEAGKYRITVSMLSRGTSGVSSGGFWQFRLDAGSTILSKIESLFVFPTSNRYGITDFGVHSFYDFETDAIINGYPLTNVTGSSFSSWYGKLHISRTVTLSASDVVRFYFNGTTLGNGFTTVAFDGNLIIEQIS